MSNMFSEAGAFTQPYAASAFNQPIGAWDTSAVADMGGMFSGAAAFNQPIGAWDTSAVADMGGMFYGASAFNQPIGAWDTSAVADMSYMFSRASAFNQPIGAWDTSAVTDMQSMFYGAVAFSQPIGAWDTSAVADMSHMFNRASAFDRPIGAWDTSAVACMRDMFYGARAFNQPIGAWDTSAVTDMKYMFKDAPAFNQPIGAWDTSAVADMSNMFNHAFAFNQPIGAWDTSAVSDMSYMFNRASAFNQPIGAWDTSAVTDMSYMFSRASAFNQPIGAWDTSAVTDTRWMFVGAPAFNQTLVLWNTSAVLSMSHIFEGAVNFTKPPCQSGSFPAYNRLGCQQCQSNQFSWKGALHCEFCSPGEVPTPDQGSCQACPPQHFAPMNADVCQPCGFPFIASEGACIWWHLVISAVVIAGVAVALKLWASRRSRKRESKIAEAMNSFHGDLWEEEASTVIRYTAVLGKLGVDKQTIKGQICETLAVQSRRAGVSMQYLLSDTFAEMATGRTNKADPTFMDMKEAFWLSDDPIGSTLRCLRDGRQGCALVDWIPREARREQTHFMSWTWQYTLSELTSALRMFQASEVMGNVHFFMCFFTNNQYRILVEESTTGSTDLEQVFEENLKRIGRMVAILDAWQQPVYLSRVWTVFEQFVASKLDIPVQFALPESAALSLQQTIRRGDAGIEQITESLTAVDSQKAKAWCQEDEIKVKSLIQESVGFAHVNRHVATVMLKWVGKVVEQHIKELMDRKADSVNYTPVAQACQ